MQRLFASCYWSRSPGTPTCHVMNTCPYVTTRSGAANLTLHNKGNSTVWIGEVFLIAVYRFEGGSGPEWKNKGNLLDVNFTRNSEAVIWIHSPQHEVLPNTPISEIYYHLDNCSIAFNRGPVIETHRDLFASANVFHWNIWSNTFVNNSNSGVAVRLPDTYDLLAKQEHSFWANEDYVDSWPRSYAVGVFGSQKAEIHFNQFKNPLMDFEVVSGCE
ncbi:hypothetical protein ANCDUO_17633, partial [Ancylostoma duodenale]